MQYDLATSISEGFATLNNLPQHSRMAGPKHYYSSRCGCGKCAKTKQRIAREEAAERNGDVTPASKSWEEQDRTDTHVTRVNAGRERRTGRDTTESS